MNAHTGATKDTSHQRNVCLQGFAPDDIRTSATTQSASMDPTHSTVSQVPPPKNAAVAASGTQKKSPRTTWTMIASALLIHQVLLVLRAIVGNAEFDEAGASPAVRVLRAH